MSTSILKFPDSEFPNVICTKLTVKPETTTFKWSPVFKHPTIIIAGAVDSARTVVIGGQAGVLGSIPFVVGNSQGTWFYDIFVAGNMYVGMALETQDFSTIAGAVVSRLLTVTEGDKVRFTLNLLNMLTIRHEAGDGVHLSTVVCDLTPYIGQTIYYWASTAAGFTMSIQVLNDIRFCITVDPDGTVQLSTFINNTTVTIPMGGGEINNGINVGSGAGVFAQKNGVDLEFKSLTNTDTLVSIVPGATEINLGINQGNITQVGTLSGGSLGVGFGAINVSAPITTTEKITGGCLDIDNLRLDGNALSSLDTNGNISLLPDGSGEALVKADPVSNLGIATKQYVDAKASAGTISGGTNVGIGQGVFAQTNTPNLEFKSLKNNDTLISVTSTTTEVIIDVNEANITQVGALNAGSITAGFGDINNGTSQITTGQVNVDNLRLDGNTLSTAPATSGNVNIIPDGSGEVILKNNPVSALGAATKQYVDAVAGTAGGSHPSNMIFNNNTVGITIEDNVDNAIYNVGVSYKVNNFTAAVGNYIMELRDHMVIISNNVTTIVYLPAANAKAGKHYIIVRNYPMQGGELWTNPALRVIPNGTDCIEFDNFVGLPPFSEIQIISDGIDRWRIL